MSVIAMLVLMVLYCPTIYFVATDEGILEIRDMKRSDAGRYECVASNQAGTDTATATVR